MRFGLLLLAVLMAAIAWGAFWHDRADRAETGIASGLNALSERGFEVSRGDLEMLGFPWRLHAALGDLQLSDGMRKPGLSVRADRIDIVTHPWTPGHQVIKAEQLRLGFSRLVLRAPQIRASHVETDSARLIDIDFGPVSIDFPATDGVALRAAQMQLHLRLPFAGVADRADDGLYGPERAEIAIRFTRLGLGPFTSSAPAPEFAELELRAELHGAIPLPLRGESLAAWRDAGGTLALDHLSAVWDRYRFSAEGSLALDEKLRPLGALTLRTDGARPLLDWFADRGLVRESAVAPARALLARLAEDSSGAAVELPLMLQDGEILLAALSLAELVPLLRP